jgi:NAD(P)-dependent dehydrogenase (short-subunit alcohol dehydrogenase family)
MQRLKGKVALVTGAARGIGRGIALCLAEEGADIIVNDLPAVDGPGAGGTVREVEKLGRYALAYDADISDREQVAALFAAGAAHFGHIDVVVANAAFSIRELVIEARWEHVLRTIEVTQFGVYHTCQAGAQQMIRQGGGGKIVIIGSI